MHAGEQAEGGDTHIRAVSTAATGVKRSQTVKAHFRDQSSGQAAIMETRHARLSSCVSRDPPLMHSS